MNRPVIHTYSTARTYTRLPRWYNQRLGIAKELREGKAPVIHACTRVPACTRPGPDIIDPFVGQHWRRLVRNCQDAAEILTLTCVVCVSAIHVHLHVSSFSPAYTCPYVHTCVNVIINEGYVGRLRPTNPSLWTSTLSAN